SYILSNENALTLSRLSLESSPNRTGFEYSSLIAADKPASSLTLTSIPYFTIANPPLLIITSSLLLRISNGPDIQFVEITGNPQAIASTITLGNPSELDVSTKQLLFCK